MKPARLFCILLCLCLLMGCGGDMARPAAEDHPPVHVTYTPDPTAIPAELLESLPDPVGTPAPDPKEGALLYAGERVSLYRACRDGAPGIYIEGVWFGQETLWYQELPHVEGQTELAVTKVVVKPEKDQAEAFVNIHFLDNTGTDMVLCFELTNPNAASWYLVSGEPGVVLTKEMEETCADLLLIGWRYEDSQQDKERLTDPEGWESLCQTRILDALYYFHGDTLPSYITGEGVYDDEYGDTAIVSQTELDAFFQSVLGRPNLVRDRVHGDEDRWPNLQPGQVPLPPTDYSGWAIVEQAVAEPDGTLRIYGCAGWSEVSYMVVCRVRPTEGFLGYRIESTEIIPVYRISNDFPVTFTP